MKLEKLRSELYELHLELRKYNLVVWTGGNISAIDRSQNLVVVKPSGVKYEDLAPDKMVIVDLEGNIVEGDLKPSSDIKSHLYVYHHMKDVGAIVHTHSTFATAFAAIGQPIPVYLTAHGDEFGGPIPCSDFALIGGEDIGKTIIDNIGNGSAILLMNHGVFTIGTSAIQAVKSAVMVEDIARTVWYALQLGKPHEIPQEQVKKLNIRYKNIYGQK